MAYFIKIGQNRRGGLIQCDPASGRYVAHVWSGRLQTSFRTAGEAEAAAKRAPKRPPQERKPAKPKLIEALDGLTGREICHRVFDAKNNRIGAVVRVEAGFAAWSHDCKLGDFESEALAEAAVLASQRPLRP